MGKKILIDLQSEILKAIELWKEWILKWSYAQDLRDKLRDTDVLKAFSNETLKLKYEKIINNIDTIWSDRRWYTWAWVFNKYKEIIDLELAQNKIKNIEGESKFKQEYFTSWEEASIRSLLINLFSDAEEEIIVYDKYFSIELLRLLCNSSNNVNLIIIYNNKAKITNEQFKAFEILYSRKIKEFPTSDNSIHDRYYIIDWKVYSIWSSVQKNINWTLFTPVIDSEGNKILSEIGKYLQNP